MLYMFIIFSKSNDSFYFFFFQQHGNPGPVAFPHFIVRKGCRVEPFRFHFFCLLDRALPMAEEVDETDVVQVRRGREVEVQETDEFQVFFPGHEARFFPELPDSALQEVFTRFYLAAEAVPLADAEAAFFAA